jgi:Fic family protein
LRLPEPPPDFDALFRRAATGRRLPEILRLAEALRADAPYLHWDEVRRRTPPQEGFTLEEWWAAIKMKRKATYRDLPVRDRQGDPFRYFLTDEVQELLHQTDAGAGGTIGLPDAIAADAPARDRYVVSSLIEEAITSSQLEGAVATREVAKEMLTSGRPPRDRSEQMILNNFRTMRRVREVRDEPLTSDLVFEMHRLVTEDTLDHGDAAGRFRTGKEDIRVEDGDGQILHVPPLASELPSRMEAMCAFANHANPKPFVHPVVRAIVLHFWLAYDHPFCDGNGRTARALFYWAMLRSGYWLFEFVSISSILVKAPVTYARSFLLTETDENDLNYFIIHQIQVIHRAIQELHAYIARKREALRTAETNLRYLRQLNHRQQALIMHGLRHPGHEYTVASHRRSHEVAYATARADLLDLERLGLLTRGIRGRAMIFEPVAGLEQNLRDLSGRIPA